MHAWTPDHRAMSRRTPILIGLVLTLLALGAAVAIADSGASDHYDSGQTKTTKPEPSKPPEDKDGDKYGTPADAAAPAPADTETVGEKPVDPQPEAKPELGHTIGIDAHQGTVKVKTPGGSWQSVAAAGTLPVGTVIDATNGHVTLRTAVDAAGNSQTGTFWGAKFEVRQVAGGVTELVLRSTRPRCPRPGTATASANRPRGLWGHDKHGKFRTRGRNAVATVRGTTWFVGERCGGTYTRVTSGSVRVWDRRTRRVVVVNAGHAYLARNGS
jgi:hypothetical protein